MPLISVAMCTYNGEPYLQAQIESILNQTHTHLELVIVDDGSTDNTFEIAKSYERQDSRVICVKNEHNLGFNKNFQKALSLTKGSYIAISDQDDIWELNKLELLLANIGDNWLIFSNSNYMTSAGEPLYTQLLANFEFGGRQYKSLLLQNWVTGHTTLFTKAFLDKILPFPQKGYYDWWMGFVAAYHHKLIFLNQTLTHYRIHANSVTQSAQPSEKRSRKVYGHKSVTDMLEELISYKDLQPEDRQFIIRLKDAMLLKNSKAISWPLFKIIYDNYEVFHFGKPRLGLSRLNFAYKYAKGF